MDKAPSKSDLLPLLEALRPHLDSKGQGIIEAALDMVDLFNSQSVQDMIKRFYKISPVVNKVGNAVSLNTQAGKMEFSSITFLILIVLVFLLINQ